MTQVQRALSTHKSWIETVISGEMSDAGFEGDSGGNMFHICMVLDKLLKQHTDALLTTLCESTERIEQSFAVMMRHLHHAPVGKLIADLACTPASSMMSDE